MDEINQLLKEYLARLPKALQTNILAGRWLDELTIIKKEYNLNENEIDQLAVETALVLFGLTETDTFQDQLKDLEPDKMTGVIQAVEEKIFEPFKDYLSLIKAKNKQENELAKRLAELPQEIKSAIDSIETSNAIRAISDKYHLHIDQAGELADEISLVMIGSTKPDRFISHIIKRLHISNELAQNIARETNQNIFIKIKEALQKVQGFEIEDDDQVKKPEPVDLFTQKMNFLFQNKKEEEENITSEQDKPITPPRHDPYKEPVE